MPSSTELLQLARSLSREPNFFWLDDTTSQGRSFLGARAQKTLRSSDAAMLRHLWTATHGPPARHSVPRWVGTIAYEQSGLGYACVGNRKAPTAGSSTCAGATLFGSPCPDPTLQFARYGAVVLLDHRRASMEVVGDDPDAVALLSHHVEAVRANRLTPRECPAKAWAPVAPVTASCSDAAHESRIRLAQEAIRDGEVYQLNLARHWQLQGSGSPLELWLKWRRRSSVPYGAYLQTKNQHVLSASMECYLDWRGPGKSLRSRPIKGTAARAAPGDSLQSLAERLRNDPKERAEHSMIVDLVRSDLARVASPGSVRVADPYAVEAYPHLAHLVSTVACTSRPDCGLFDVLDATFPAGSISGAPKTSAMALIAALEQHPRGIYTGAIGYFDTAGGCQFSVAIRTAVLSPSTLSYGAGGGITIASRPHHEVQETWLKARSFFAALERRPV